MKKGWVIPIFTYIKIKWSRWVSYSFKAALDYSSLCRLMHFWCYDTTLKKIFSIEKLNLTSNNQTNFNKLGPLYRDFQIVLRVRVNGKFAGEHSSFGWWESEKEWIWPLKPFSKLKTTLCKYWPLIKSKLAWPVCTKSMYEGKIKVVQ